MKEDLKTLSENITELSNNFVAAAVSKARNSDGLVFVSILQAAPNSMPEYYVQKYLELILSELNARPEIKSIRLPESTVELSESEKSTGKLAVAVECAPEYLFFKRPTKNLSMARLAELGEKAVEYVREESKDFAQDMTERLGLSMNELSILDPSLRVFEVSEKSSERILEPLEHRIKDAEQRSEVQTSKGPSHSEYVFE